MPCFLGFFALVRIGIKPKPTDSALFTKSTHSFMSMIQALSVWLTSPIRGSIIFGFCLHGFRQAGFGRLLNHNEKRALIVFTEAQRRVNRTGSLVRWLDKIRLTSKQTHHLEDMGILGALFLIAPEGSSSLVRKDQKLL